VAVGAAAIMLSGCGLIGGTATLQMDVPDVMTVTSPDLPRGGISQAFICPGPGKHPAIHWSGAPADTKSLALVMDDAAAPINPYIYWIVFDIGPQTTDIQEGALPPGARQARNSKGSLGYSQPCPAKPGHSYRFTVYALGKVLRLNNGVGMQTAWTAIAHAATARGRFTTAAIP
jgi:Raf kinase inhibitor-like YbhB/YbcL family protein